MSNQIETVKLLQKEIDVIISQLKETREEIINISKSSREINTSFKSIKKPSSLNDSLKDASKNTQQLNALVKEQDRLEKNLISTGAKYKLATESTNRALIKNRFELQQQNKLIKEASVISSRYSTLLQKTTALRNKEARVIQDLNLKKALGNKLSDKEQKELKQSQIAFNKYNKAVRGAKESVGRFQENVGKYPTLLGSVRELTTGLIGAFGLLEGARLAFDFAKESLQLAREAKGVEFAFQRLGFEGQEAFEKIKVSTRGVLSDLDIKRSLNEFKNFNISLEQTDVLFEFLAVRAAQTGRSVDSLKDSLVEGLSKESKLRIDNLGISAAKLNEELERTPNFVEAVANIAKTEISAAGDILDEATSSQEKFNASVENLQVSLGSGVIGRFTNSIYSIGTALISVISDINTASDSFGEFFVNILKVSKGQAGLVATEAAIKKEQQKRVPLTNEIIKLQKEQGVIELQLNLNKEKYLRTSSKELSILLKKLKAEKEQKEITKDSVKELRAKIASLREEQEGLTINDRARSLAINNEIKQTEKLIKTILGEEDAREQVQTRLDGFVKGYENAEKAAKAFSEVFKDELKFNFDDQEIVGVTEALNRFNDKVFENKLRIDLIKGAFNDLSGTIEQFTGISSGVLNKFFEDISTKGFEAFTDISDIAASSFGVISEVSNSYFNSQISELDAQIEANQLFYDNLLENENLTEQERDRIEKDKQAKERKILEEKKKQQQKQAEINKALAIANIGLSTAEGVASAASTIATLPLIPFILGIGAAQLAIAAATPIPKFAEGGTMDHDGLMMINDHSSGRLEVVERDGKFLMTNKKNAIIEGKKGDKIHKDAGKFFESLSDEEITSNINHHAMMSSIYSNINVAQKVESLRVINSAKRDTDRIVKAINKSKPVINLHNDNSIGEELAYFKRGDF